MGRNGGGGQQEAVRCGDRSGYFILMHMGSV
jgi:hypothetical protein